MTKIVFCYTIATTYNFSIETIKLLKDNGFEVVLISSEKQKLIEMATNLYVGYKYLNLTRNYSIIKDLVAIYKLTSILRNLKPDIVVGATPKASLISMIASRFAGTKHRIYHIFGLPYETASGLIRKILIIIEKITSNFSTDIIPISHSIREVYINKFPSMEHKIHNIGSLTVGGVDLSKFNKERFFSEFEKLRLDLGIPNDSLIVGFVARLTWDKGIGDFIAMWNIVKKKRGKVFALIIGSVDTRDSYDLQKLGEFLNESRVFHIERVIEIEKYFSLIDIFVMPSYREGFGNVNIEASSLKIPIVSYNVTGCKDSVQNGYSGILVDKGDIVSLSNEVISLIDSPTNRRLFGEQGRIFVEKNFTVKNVANNFYNYCSLIKRGN
jgi:glycosyltransferase involved in cell wall biosynthesis